MWYFQGPPVLWHVPRFLSFLWPNNIAWMDHILCMHSPHDEHFNGFPIVSPGSYCYECSYTRVCVDTVFLSLSCVSNSGIALGETTSVSPKWSYHFPTCVGHVFPYVLANARDRLSLIKAVLMGVRWSLGVIWGCVFPMTNHVKWLFMGSMTFRVSSLDKRDWSLLPILKMRWFIVLCLSCDLFTYSVHRYELQMFSPMLRVTLFTLLTACFEAQNALPLMKFNWSVFS